jgi:Domain of unknown function (DUF4349)
VSVHEDLKAFLDGELSPERAAEVQAAIDQDPALRDEVLFMKNISGAIHSAAKEPQVAGLEEAVKKAAKPRWSFSFPRWLSYSAAGLAGVFLVGLVGTTFFPVFGQANLAAKKTMDKSRWESSATADAAKATVAGSPPAISDGAQPSFERKKSDITGYHPSGVNGATGGGGEAPSEYSDGQARAGDSYRVPSSDQTLQAAPKGSLNESLALRTGSPDEPKTRAPENVRAGHQSLGGGKAKTERVRGADEAQPLDSEGLTTTSPGPTYLQGERRVVRNANIGLKVADVGKAMDETESQVMAVGGFVQDTKFNAEEDSSHGTMNFQVPEKNFNATVEYLGKLGKVVRNDKTGQDVTGQIADSDSRIRSLADEEGNLIQELTRTKDSSDRWAIRNRLSSIRQDMDAYKAVNKRTKDLADMSRFAVSFEKSGQFDNASPNDWFGQTTQGAGNVLGFFGRVFGVGLIYVAFLAPIWLPITGIVWWLRKRGASRAA